MPGDGSEDGHTPRKRWKESEGLLLHPVGLDSVFHDYSRAGNAGLFSVVPLRTRSGLGRNTYMGTRWKAALAFSISEVAERNSKRPKVTEGVGLNVSRQLGVDAEGAGQRAINRERPNGVPWTQTTRPAKPDFVIHGLFAVTLRQPRGSVYRARVYDGALLCPRTGTLCRSV